MALPAQIWAPVHDNVCIRHKLWVGQHVHAPEEQLDLPRTPDAVQILKGERLIELRPGRGAVVTADAPSQALVIEACRHLIRLAR